MVQAISIGEHHAKQSFVATYLRMPVMKFKDKRPSKQARDILEGSSKTLERSKKSFKEGTKTLIRSTKQLIRADNEKDGLKVQEKESKETAAVPVRMRTKAEEKAEKQMQLLDKKYVPVLKLSGVVKIWKAW